ncbi:hypothetical protein ISCGN_012782 [Ixodes scapularis]
MVFGVWMTREVPKRKPFKVPCRGEVSVRSGSFFEGSHLTLPQLMKIIYLWCQNLPCAVIQRETDVATGGVDNVWTTALTGERTGLLSYQIEDLTSSRERCEG